MPRHVGELHVWGQPPQVIVTAYRPMTTDEALEFADDIIAVARRAEKTHARVTRPPAEGSTVGQVDAS